MRETFRLFAVHSWVLSQTFSSAVELRDGVRCVRFDGVATKLANRAAVDLQQEFTVWPKTSLFHQAANWRDAINIEYMLFVYAYSQLIRPTV